MKVWKLLTVVMMVVFFATPLFADEILELQCGTEIIERDASEAEVLEKCGEPTYKEGNQWIYDRGETEKLIIVYIIDGRVAYMEEQDRL
jgi:hypothetical protein